MTKFRGCTPYAHIDTLNLETDESWIGRAEFDHCSLALTCASLLAADCQVPWYGFNRPRGARVSRAELTNRLKVATQELLVLSSASSLECIKFLGKDVPQQIHELVGSEKKISELKHLTASDLDKRKSQLDRMKVPELKKGYILHRFGKQWIGKENKRRTDEYAVAAAAEAEAEAEG